MDARSPLSPRASAFSIASLVAAEAAERSARLGPGSSNRAKLHRLPDSPAGMHFSTVTRDMEGEPSRSVYTARPPDPLPLLPQRGLAGLGAEWGCGELCQGGLQASGFNSGAEKGQASCPKLVPPPAWGPRYRDLHKASHRPRRGEWRRARTGEEDQRKGQR